MYKWKVHSQITACAVTVPPLTQTMCWALSPQTPGAAAAVREQPGAVRSPFPGTAPLLLQRGGQNSLYSNTKRNAMRKETGWYETVRLKRVKGIKTKKIMFIDDNLRGFYTYANSYSLVWLACLSLILFGTISNFYCSANKADWQVAI